MAILPLDGRMPVLSKFLGDLRSLALRPPSGRPVEIRCTDILQRGCSQERKTASRDRRKLEELSSRKTRHPVVFSWQTQFAGAALRILRSSPEP
jgi:hypothetical protein